MKQRLHINLLRVKKLKLNFPLLFFLCNFVDFLIIMNLSSKFVDKDWPTLIHQWVLYILYLLNSTQNITLNIFMVTTEIENLLVDKYSYQPSLCALCQQRLLFYNTHSSSGNYCINNHRIKSVSQKRRVIDFPNNALNETKNWEWGRIDW